MPIAVSTITPILDYKPGANYRPIVAYYFCLQGTIQSIQHLSALSSYTSVWNVCIISVQSVYNQCILCDLLISVVFETDNGITWWMLMMQVYNNIFLIQLITSNCDIVLSVCLFIASYTCDRLLTSDISVNQAFLLCVFEGLLDSAWDILILLMAASQSLHPSSVQMESILCCVCVFTGTLNWRRQLVWSLSTLEEDHSALEWTTQYTTGPRKLTINSLLHWTQCSLVSMFHYFIYQ